MADERSVGSQSADQKLEEELRASLVNGSIPCAVAFKIAQDQKVSNAKVGELANQLDIKVSNCQLGCFP